LRLLTNLETHQRKLLQIILLGQPELLDVLAKPELRQLSQRITARFHLDALTREEITAYIRHRLSVAGAKGNFFSKRAIDQIYRISDGIPRIINLVCDRSLLGAYSEGEMQVTPKIVAKAAKEILGPEKRASMDWRRIAIAAIVCLTIVTGYLLFDVATDPSSEPRVTQTEQGADFQVTEPREATPPQPYNARNPSETMALPQASASDQSPGNPQIYPMSDPMDLSTSVATAATSTRSNQNGSVSQTQQAEAAYTPYTPLTSLMGHANFQAALNDLLGLWDVDFTDPDTATCDLAETIGLFCYESVAGLNEMNDFNRPVIVNLNGRWFTLTQLSRQSAYVISTDTAHEVEISELLDAWNGNFTLLWRAPPGYQVPLTVGDRGPAVDWLVNRLAIINNVNPPLSPGYVFDGALESRVRQFQLSSGLTPDGIAGVKTWIKINDRDGVPTPRLDDEAS